MRLRVQLTSVAARGLRRDPFWERHAPSWAFASGAWVGFREALRLDPADVVAVTVRDDAGDRIASVGWFGAIWGTVPHDVPGSDAALLYSPFLEGT